MNAGIPVLKIAGVAVVVDVLPNRGCVVFVVPNMEGCTVVVVAVVPKTGGGCAVVVVDVLPNRGCVVLVVVVVVFPNREGGNVVCVFPKREVGC